MRSTDPLWPVLLRSCLSLIAFTLAHSAMGTEPREQELTFQALNGIPVKPSDTDREITAFNNPHYVYVDRDIVVAHDARAPADRHELLLFIPGTNGTGKGAVRFCQLAARYGYHVIFLMYPDDVPASICRDDPDPNAFRDFRMAIITGGKTSQIAVSRTDSIENRLIKLLMHLKRIRPREDWGQFLTASGELKWSSFAVAGQSQGGGHAALIGVTHLVARVIGTGAPKDYSVALNRPAQWYSQVSATPKDRFFFFNHQQDHQGCTPEQCLENVEALGLGKFGHLVDVDRSTYPYQHSHNLTTDYPGGKLESKKAHTTVIADKNAALFERVWLYMLTE